MTDDVKTKDIIISDEDAEKLSDEDLIASEKPVSKPVFRKRIGKLIAQRNALREKETSWTAKEKEMLEEMAELEDYKKLKELANSDPRIAKGIMRGLNEELGEEEVKNVKGIPTKVRKTGKSEEDRDIEDIKQELADMKIEKHFDAIGVKPEEIKKLTEFCEKQGISMINKTLLEMAYAKVFPKTEEEVDKTKEPDSSTVSGINYGDEEVKTIDDAIAFAKKYLGKQKK